jgi:hypothetical protein
MPVRRTLAKGRGNVVVHRSDGVSYGKRRYSRAVIVFLKVEALPHGGDEEPD